MSNAAQETPKNVADEATKPADLSSGRTLLIGTAGPDGAMSALVRLSGGKIVKLATGDRLDGGKVQNIETGRLTLLRRGHSETLTVPSS
ncbi:hypothetical protein [Aliiroseovarius subalbicans]|uniref:hypothetical protein n=1 Tax=Aliiroseovarius subalbicans TaxID=2925840 RepID=UPI001F578D79|nr:hypothetical protein [Aliiroseovarius subalbicans]MCI2398677.1 hypothetical protein [Aliiroseovarius subalbicans]